MKAFLSFLLSAAITLAPFATVPAHARARQVAPTGFFCPAGALASFYAPTTNAPTNDGCFTAPQPQTDGSMGGFKLANCWTGGGLGAMNTYNGTTTDYSVANSSPLNVSTPWNSYGCEVPVGLMTPLASLADPAPGGTPTSAIADCVYSAAGSFEGFPLFTCTPTLAHSPGGVFTVKGYDFGTEPNHPCLALEIPSVGAGVTEIDIINNNFTNDSGSCSTWQFNPVMFHEAAGFAVSGIKTKVYNNVFNGNGFTWRSDRGSCPSVSDQCNPVEAVLINGDLDFRRNLFTNWIGRTIATDTGTGMNYTLFGNLFLGGDVAGPEHGEFTQTFVDGVPANDHVSAFNNFSKTTGSTDTWDALQLTTYTGKPGGAWNHVVLDHNIYIPGASGGGQQGAGLTGCTIAAGTSTLTCTGVTGGKVGSGSQAISGGPCGGINFMLDSLTSASGVQGTDWDNAGPGGGQWVLNGASTWGIDANAPGGLFQVIGGIDDGTGGTTPGNILTVTTPAAYSISITGRSGIAAGVATATFTETSANNFLNGDTMQVGNNTYTLDSAAPTVAGHVYIGNANLSTSGFSQSGINLNAAVNGSAQPKAQAVLSMSTNFSNSDTLVIGNNTFHAVTSLGATAGNFLIGASNSATITALALAINTPGSCTTTCVAPTNTPNLTAVNNGGGKATFSAITAGSSGNSLTSTITTGGTGSFTTGATFINGVAYVAPGTTPNITASRSATTITFLNKVVGSVGNSNPSVYTASGTSAGSFPNPTFDDGVNTAIPSAYLSATGGVGTYCLTGGVGGLCTPGAGAQYVPPGSTLNMSIVPYYAGEWTAQASQTCPSPQNFQHSVIPAVVYFMGFDTFNGSAITNNLPDSDIANTSGWTPWFQVVTNPSPPACGPNDMIGADPSNPNFTIFGTQNLDPNHLVPNVNNWRNTGFSNGCGP